MSGFFMTRRAIVAELAPALSPDGFKILVDVVLSLRRPLTIVETPYVFRQRQAGESKLSPLVGLDFLGLVAHHATGGVLPIRFVLFALIGGVGLVVHLAVLSAAGRFGRRAISTTARSSRPSRPWRAISRSTTRSPTAPIAIAGSA